MSTPGDLLARLDVLAVLDRTAVAALRDPELGGDDEFLIEVIQTFLDDSPQHVTTVQAAFAAGDAPKLMRAAHSLKGSSGNFGAARLQALCAQVELQARAGQLDGLSPLVERVEREYGLLAEQLQALAAEASSAQTAAR